MFRNCRREWDMGRYQWLVVCVYAFCAQPWNYANTAIIFIAPKVDHWCQDSSPSFQNLNYSDQKAVMGDSCSKPDVDFNQFTSEELISMNFTDYNRTSCENGYVFNRKFFDWTLTEKMALVCDRGWWRNMINTVYMFGYLVSALGSGAIADRFGRRPTFLAFGLVGTLAHAADALVPTVEWFIIFRFVASVCDMGVYIGTFIVTLEIVKPQHRKLPGIFNGIVSSAISSLLGVIVMIIPNFEHLLYFIATWYFLALVLQYFVYPESPRWLAAKNRMSELKKIEDKITKMNGKCELLQHLNIQEDAEKEGEKSNIMDLFRTPNLRKRSLILCIIWFTLVLVWYALMFGLQDFGPDVRISHIISSFIDVPGIVFILFTVDRLGRQITGFAFMLMAGSCCLAMSPIVENQGSYILMTLALLGKFFSSMQFSIVYLHTPELYPTVCRTTGLGFSSTVARIAGMIAPQLSLVNKIWPQFLVVTLGLCGLISAALTPFIPDTTGKELPQTLEEGENFCSNHGYKLVLPGKRAVKHIDDDNVTQM